MAESYDQLLERTESWFVRRGLPYFIEDRKATEDVFTSALPLLLVYFVANLMVVLSLHLTAPQRIGGATLGVLLLALLYMVRNMFKGEKAVGLPSQINWFELGGFVAIPPIVAYVARHRIRDALIDLGVDVGVVLLIYVVASALLPLANWAFRRTFQELGEVFDLAARALPLVFLFNSFLFISGDVWEFAGGESMTSARLSGVVGLFAVFTVLFLLYRLPEEVQRVAAHDDRTTIVEACKATPMDGVITEVVLHEGALPLSRAQRVNVLMVLFVGQILQVVLLGVLVFLFFIGFGRLAITPALINEWTKKPENYNYPVTLFGNKLSDYIGIGIDHRLWQVSVFLGAVSAFFFAISSMTDEAYKAQFYARMNRELETAIQVRRVYLALYERRYSVESELSASGVHFKHIDTAHTALARMTVPRLLEAEAAVQHELHLHEHSHHPHPPTRQHPVDEPHAD
ncbi:hypothetical protein KDL01_34625 [Actinospica durhamensis]|uniref:Uncharacterized protein n=1 Tax=Actinospica durhamensis TaxID=1508375 RepID=A0A941IV28_9ACTN|nr:hypothetical protein [Actinospica durhamensis]MBR7838453.1 hypothetical protein [Actinospica durhamensis]